MDEHKDENTHERLRSLAKEIERTAFEFSRKDKNGELVKTAQILRLWAFEFEKDLKTKKE